MQDFFQITRLHAAQFVIKDDNIRFSRLTGQRKLVCFTTSDISCGIWARFSLQHGSNNLCPRGFCQPCKLQQRLVAVQTDQKRAFLIFLRGIRRADEHLAIRAFNGIHPGALRKFVDRSNLGQMHTIHTADIFAQKCRLYAGCVTVFRPNSRHRVKPHGT